MKGQEEITNSENVIDSRDVIDRIQYLESLRDDFQDDNNLPSYAGLGESDEWQEWDESEEAQELDVLQRLADDAEGYAEGWRYGVALIRESYFTDYARELIEDCGNLPRDLPAYIENNINWDGVAEDLLADYTAVDFDGVTYYVR